MTSSTDFKKIFVMQRFILSVMLLVFVSNLRAEVKPGENVTSANTDNSKTVELLLKNNREVRAAEQALKSVQERVKTLGVLPDPVIENSFYLNPVETRNGPMENQIMLGQKFPLWGKLKRERLIAQLQVNNAGYNLRDKQITVVFQMNKHWANYLRYSQSLLILDKFKSELESFRNIALTQYSTGIGITQHPILKLQIEMSLVESQINTLQSDVDVAINALQNLFNGTFTQKLFSADWDYEIPDKTAQDRITLADQSNPALLKVRNDVEIAKIMKELAQRKNYPDLLAGVTYTSVGQTDLAGAPSPGADGLGVKIGLNLPIWLKRNKARIESSILTIKSREELVADTKNQITDEIRSLSKELFEIDETYALYDKTLIQESEQMLASAYAAYETGKISFLDLLDSERMVVKIRLEFENIKAKKRITSAKLTKAVGLISLAKE